MITYQNFVWLHLPKTAGTSTAALFRKLNIDGVIVDPDIEDEKHQSIEDRLGDPTATTTKTKIITSRRLASWLVSDWHHKTKKMGLKLPFEPVKSGLFYSLRLGGTWVAADYWIHYFKAKSCEHTIRIENIEEDSNRVILPLLPRGTHQLKLPKKNENSYNRNLEHFFGKRDLKRIYQNNPAWSSWENNIYGNLLSINQIKRIKEKLTT